MRRPMQETTERWNPGLVAAILAALVLGWGCSSTGTKEMRIDQTDKRQAVQTEPADTVYVDSLRVDTMWMPGMTVTVPETVEVAADAPTARDTSDAFPLQEVAVDSAQVRLTGLTERHVLAAPCFGETLVGRATGGEMEFYVKGDCTQRDTIVRIEYEKESWLDRTLDKIGRWISLVALLGIGLYILWGTISTTIRAALPW